MEIAENKVDTLTYWIPKDNNQVLVRLLVFQVEDKKVNHREEQAGEIFNPIANGNSEISLDPLSEIVKAFSPKIDVTTINGVNY